MGGGGGGRERRVTIDSVLHFKGSTRGSGTAAARGGREEGRELVRQCVQSGDVRRVCVCVFINVFVCVCAKSPKRG